MKRTILAAVVAVAALAPSAQAQVMNPIRFGISGGVSIPTSDPIDFSAYSLEPKTGYNAAVHLGFQVPLFPVGLRADIGFNSFDGKESNEGDFGLPRRVDADIVSGTLNAVVQPTGVLVAKPYVIGGVGAYRVKTDVERNSVIGGPSSTSESSTDVGVNGGAGVRFGLAGFSTFLEARYHYVFNKAACGSGEENCVSRKPTTFVPISFGIMF